MLWTQWAYDGSASLWTQILLFTLVHCVFDPHILCYEKFCLLLLLRLLLESSFTFTSNQVVLERLAFTSTREQNKSSPVTPEYHIWNNSWLRLKIIICCRHAWQYIIIYALYYTTNTCYFDRKFNNISLDMRSFSYIMCSAEPS